MTGTVEFIHFASEAGADPKPRDAVEAVGDRGLRGDRYFDDAGTFSTPDEEDVTWSGHSNRKGSRAH